MVRLRCWQVLFRDEGLLDLNTYQTEELLGITFGMNKAERLEYGESLMTHAMVLGRKS